MPEEILIRASRLSRFLGGKLAVDDVSLEVRGGSVLGLLGPNGAGKTTLLRMLAGELLPTSGVIHHRGEGGIGFLTGAMKLYNRLTPLETMRYLGELRGLQASRIALRQEELVARLGMSKFCRKRFERLSSGERQRSLIACTLLHDPSVLILDEITVALDPIASGAILEIVREEKARGKCIVFSTHIMSEAEHLCDRVLLMHQGRAMDSDSPRELLGRYGVSSLTDAFIAAARKYGTAA